MFRVPPMAPPQQHQKPRNPEYTMAAPPPPPPPPKRGGTPLDINGRLFVRIPPGSAVDPNRLPTTIYFVGPGDALGYGGREYSGMIFVATYQSDRSNFGQDHNTSDIEFFPDEASALAALRSDNYPNIPHRRSGPFHLYQVRHTGQVGQPARIHDFAWVVNAAGRNEPYPFVLDLNGIRTPQPAHPYPYPYGGVAPQAAHPAPGFVGGFAKPVSPYGDEYTAKAEYQDLPTILDRIVKKNTKGKPSPLYPGPPHVRVIVTDYAGNSRQSPIDTAVRQPTEEREADYYMYLMAPFTRQEIHEYLRQFSYRFVHTNPEMVDSPFDVQWLILPEIIRGDIRTVICLWKRPQDKWTLYADGEHFRL